MIVNLTNETIQISNSLVFPASRDPLQWKVEFLDNQLEIDSVSTHMEIVTVQNLPSPKSGTRYIVPEAVARYYNRQDFFYARKAKNGVFHILCDPSA